MLGTLMVALATLGQADAKAPAPAPEVQLSPNTELAAALRHLATVPPQYRKDVRYLTLYNVPAEKREDAWRCVTFAMNVISRANSLQPVVAAVDHPTLLAVYWETNFRLPREGWEAMVNDEPYFHIPTDAKDPKTKKNIRVVTDGGWMDLQATALLRQATGSAGAIMRADYFIAKSQTTLNGGLYYELAGIPPKEADWYKLIGIDRAQLADYVGTAEIGANMYRSDVTRKPRRVVRRQSPLGGAWQTFDTDAATPEKDPFRNPFEFEFQAGEYIASKPNGLHYFGLYDNKGNRADTVPDVIAKDHRDTIGPGVLAPGVACIRCHDTGGLLAVRNDQKRLLSGPVDAKVKSPAVADRLKAFYDSPRANVVMARDREDYNLAVKSITGQTVDKIGASLCSMFDTYLYVDITPETASFELGVPVAEFSERMRGAQDPTLLSLMVGIPVQRQQWESAFAEAAVLSYGAGVRMAQAEKGNLE